MILNETKNDKDQKTSNCNAMEFTVYQPCEIPMVPHSIYVCGMLRDGVYLDYDDGNEPNILLYEKIHSVEVQMEKVDQKNPITSIDNKYLTIGNVIAVKDIKDNRDDAGRAYYIDKNKTAREIYKFFDDLLEGFEW